MTARALRRRARRLARPALVWTLIGAVAFASLPADLLPAWLPVSAPRPAAAETLASPRYVSAAVMPNGNVGVVFTNVGTSSEVRFLRYTDEHSLASSVQLSTAAPAYPQIAVLGSTVVAAYIDTRSPNDGKLIIRTSTDSGSSWSSESNPFGSETFDYADLAPRLVANKAGTTLYLFTAASSAIPQYRYTTNLSSWTSAAAAGDSSMHIAELNNCGSAGAECGRAHAFSFMETATAGTWVYVAKSASGYGQSGRGTQVGTLGGSWSTQVDHGGSGGLSGGGESAATTFLGRDGSVYYVRAGEYGESLYYKRSIDGGVSWGPRIAAFSASVANYTTASPVGLYVSGYSMGEYVWYAGFGGFSEDTLRVTPLWGGPTDFSRSGTARLIGSAGSDIDAASLYPYNFGQTASQIGAGGYQTSATDLQIAGRVLPFAFTRTYNSADENRPGPLGPGWSHSYDWSVIDGGSFVTLKRGSGERDRFTKNTDGSYTSPPGVTDTLVNNTDGTFTLTTRDQIKYELGNVITAYSSAVATSTPAGYWRLGDASGTTATDSSSNSLNGTYAGTYSLNMPGALGADTNTAVEFGGGYADMGSPSALNITGTALTVEFWAQASSVGSYKYIVSHTNDSSQGYAVYTGGDATYHFFFGRSGGLHISGAVSGVWDGAWHHFVNVYDGAHLLIYVDGQQRLSESETASITGYTGNFRVGDYNGGSRAFSGLLDEVAVYSSALSASTVADHYAIGMKPSGVLTKIHEPAGNHIDLAYTGPKLTTITDTTGRQMALSYDDSLRLAQIADPTGRTVYYHYDAQGRLSAVTDAISPSGSYSSVVSSDSPAGYWRLGESSGTSAADQTSTNTGTYSGGYTLGGNSSLWNDTNTSVAFNGSSGKVTTGVTSLPTGTSARTVEAWIKPLNSGGGAIYSENTSGQQFEFLDYTWSGTTYLFTDSVNSNNNVTMSGAEIPPVGVWSHVAFVFDGGSGQWHYYLNGALVKSGSFGTALNTATLSSATIADRVQYSVPFPGSIDEFAIYPSALSATRIAAHYNAGRAANWFYGYDGVSRHISTVTGPDGKVVLTNTYDSYGRLTSQKDGLNNETDFSYGSSLTITDPRLHETTETFDSRSRLLTVSDTLSSTTYTKTFTYDDCGNVDSVTDRNGNTTNYSFDTDCNGDLLTLDEPAIDGSTPRFETTWTYDSKNNPTLRTDAKGYTTAWTYDSSSNVKTSETRQIDGSTSAVTKWQYTDSGNPGLPTRLIAPRGNTTGTPNNTYSTVLAYDSSGNLTSSTDADGNETTYGYDSLGRRTSMVDPDGNVSGGTPSQHTWTTAYDAMERVTSQTDPLSHSTSSTFDGYGHVLTQTDKNGNVTTYTYDDAGRLATVAQQPDPSGSPSTVYTTSITRDDNGNVTEVTQGNSVQTDYSYDAMNRLTTTTTHPTGGTTLSTVLTLDGNGNVTNRHTADGVDTSYTFDNDGRLTQISASGLSTITFGYDELSRRTSMADVTGTTTYTYDRMGRLTQAAQPNGTVSYAYDLDSNRTTVTTPSSHSVTYSFSNAGRLSSLTDWASRTSSYTYTAAGLAATVTLPNSMVTTYTYDRAQRLTNLTNVISSTTITSHAYTLDSAGNRTALSEFVSGITSGSSDSFGFTYDGLERLTGVTTTNAESFTLDGASNITARTGPSATYTIDGSNRPTSDGTNTLTWSSADRLTGRGSDSFSYDPLDRLTSSTVSSTTRTYAYNGDGLLQSRTTGGSTVNLLWDLGTSPSRLLVSGSDTIVYGLGPLYSVNGSTVTTYARDGQKSIRAELNGSSVTGSWRYLAYGAITQHSGSATPSILGYAGQLRDPSALYYMRARWYDPTTGRFLSHDPSTADLTVPAQANRFAYANANPQTYSDPSGYCVPFCLALAALLAPEGIAAIAATVTTVSLFVMRYGPTIASFVQQAAPTAERAAEVVAPRAQQVASSGNQVQSALARPIIVIGESSARVAAFASRIGAETYVEDEATQSLDFSERLALNAERLAEKLQDGYAVYDMGLDPDRAGRGAFYNMESMFMQLSDYPFWVRGVGPR